MKFLFINKPFIMELLGPMYLSSTIQDLGHETELSLNNEDLEEKVRNFKPDMVGYSIMTGDQDYYDSINRELKRNFDFFSIAGGPHPTFFPEMIYGSSFDAICIGEGENAIKEFIKNPNSKKTSNFWFKIDEEVIKNPVTNLVSNLDSLPFPDRQMFLKYPEKDEGIKHFIASRGCPFNCSYCFNESYSKLYKGKGKRVRFRSVDNLLEEVEEAIQASPTRFVYFQDDTFILKQEWIKEFSGKYKDRIGLPFHCHTRANLVNEEIVKDLANAGCYAVHVAAESGDERIRRELLNRKMTDKQIISSMDLFRMYGIKTMLQNILGLPFTTLEDDIKTLELNIRCKPDYAWVSIFQPYPKTKLGERCVQEGVYQGDFSDIGNNFYDQSVIDISHKNERLNLQKLFAIAVEHPRLYRSGNLQRLIQIPYEETKEKFTLAYNKFRKKGNQRLYGFDL